MPCLSESIGCEGSKLILDCYLRKERKVRYNCVWLNWQNGLTRSEDEEEAQVV